MNCSLCNIDIPQGRIDMGYTICTKCSIEDKVSCHTIYPHKTGGYIQVVSKEQSQRLNKLDRRCVGGVKKAKYLKPFVVEKIDKPKPFRNRRCNKVYTSYDEALDKVSNYYEEWGYEPTLKYLRLLNSNGEIPLMTRVKIQDIITDRYLEPTPRALARRFSKGLV